MNKHIMITPNIIFGCRNKNLKKKHHRKTNVQNLKCYFLKHKITPIEKNQSYNTLVIEIRYNTKVLNWTKKILII